MRDGNVESRVSEREIERESAGEIELSRQSRAERVPVSRPCVYK